MNNRKLERLKSAKKRKKIIHIVIILLCVFTVVGIKLNPFDNGKATAIEPVTKSQELNEYIENDENLLLQAEEVNNVIEPEPEPEISEVKITEVVPEESQEVKAIVEKYIREENLSEDNFAFFYYNPKTEKYYFYNENTFFTAASTIKVPLAMIYYDKINNGDLSYDSTFQYKSWHYEAGTGRTASEYKAGDSIKLSFLLEQMIVNSDNTATNILKENLGGEKAYRILIKQYTKRDLPEEFNNENVTSAGYSYDVLMKLYENQDKYADLIGFMKRSSGGGYLKKGITNYEIAHKYGSFQGNVHDYGICYTENEYLVGVFTKEIHNAEDLISNINKEIIQVK